MNGTNLVITTDSGEITVKGAKDKNVAVTDTSGTFTIKNEYKPVTLPDGWSISGSFARATVANAENIIDLNESYGANVTKVDGYRITGGVEIYGNDLGNSIRGSKGDDIISGGVGNDSVSLGGGADLYIYTGGDDYIYDYATVDAIQIDTTEINVESSVKSGTNCVITTSEGYITLKGAASKNINLIDENDENISIPMASKYVAENLWFMEDDFVACDLDSITEEKFAVTDIETENVENIEKAQNILTFTDKK